MDQQLVQNSENLPGEQSYILRTKVTVDSSIFLDRQSARKRIYCGFWCLYAVMSKMVLSSEELETARVSRRPTTVIAAKGVHPHN